jgi:hypothetical protein
MVAVNLMLGCSGPVKLVFDKAVVQRPLIKDGKMVFDSDGKAKMEVSTITDREEVAKLAAFFPGMGQGKESSIAGGWKAGYTVRFERDKGDPLTIRTDDQCLMWSEGQGDWKPKAGLKAFMDDLFKKERPKRDGGDGSNEAADAGWSKPVNGLQGRLVRHPKPTVNSTQIIGIAVELKNASTEPMAVPNDPASVNVELFDSDGKPVPQTALPRSGPVPLPQWGVLPRDSYLGFSLYDYGVGIPKDQGALLSLLPPVKAWLLNPGKYTLAGTFTVPKGKLLPKDAWVGRLDLLPLGIEVR